MDQIQQSLCDMTKQKPACLADYLSSKECVFMRKNWMLKGWHLESAW